MLFDDSLKKKIDDVPPFTLQLKHLVDVYRGDAEPNCSAIEGLKDLVVLESMVESMRTRRPVDVPEE
jgi:predicted dehydrogenase